VVTRRSLRAARRICESCDLRSSVGERFRTGGSGDAAPSGYGGARNIDLLHEVPRPVKDRNRAIVRKAKGKLARIGEPGKPDFKWAADD
jgi:hypothetical protein